MAGFLSQVGDRASSSGGLIMETPSWPCGAQDPSATRSIHIGVAHSWCRTLVSHAGVAPVRHQECGKGLSGLGSSAGVHSPPSHLRHLWYTRGSLVGPTLAPLACIACGGLRSFLCAAERISACGAHLCSSLLHFLWWPAPFSFLLQKE